MYAKKFKNNLIETQKCYLIFANEKRILKIHLTDILIELNISFYLMYIFVR